MILLGMNLRQTPAKAQALRRDLFQQTFAVVERTGTRGIAVTRTKQYEFFTLECARGHRGVPELIHVRDPDLRIDKILCRSCAEEFLGGAEAMEAQPDLWRVSQVGPVLQHRRPPGEPGSNTPSIAAGEGMEFVGANARLDDKDAASILEGARERVASGRFSLTWERGVVEVDFGAIVLFCLRCEEPGCGAVEYALYHVKPVDRHVCWGCMEKLLGGLEGMDARPDDWITSRVIPLIR